MEGPNCLSLRSFFLYIILEFTNTRSYGDAQKVAKNIGLICESMGTWTGGDKEHFFNLEPGEKGEFSHSVYMLEFAMAE